MNNEETTIKDGILRLFFFKRRDRNLSDKARYKAGEYSKKKLPEKELYYLNQSLLFDPYNHQSYVDRGNYYFVNKQPKKAVCVFSFATLLDKKCLTAYVNRASVCIRLANYKMALKDIEIAMNLEGYKEPPLYYMQGLCFMNLGDYQKALSCFHDAEILGFKDVMVYKQKGLVLEKLNDRKESYRYLKKAHQKARTKEDKQFIKAAMKRVSSAEINSRNIM